MVVNRWARSISRSFMAKQGREGCGQEQDYLTHRFQLIISNSPGTAVKQFQSRHGLETDGVVGKGTLAAMNVPVDARIDQIRVNLDRARWVSQDIPETYAARHGERSEGA